MPASNPQVREAIEQEASARGWAAMHNELYNIDPVAAARIHPNHSQRINRALEVYRVSGKAISEWQQGFSGGLLDEYSCVQIALAPSQRSYIHQCIAGRFDHMLSAGLIDEVSALYSRGDLHTELPAIRAVGYRQIWSYLQKEVDYDTMLQMALAATRQLAKRQFTWLRSWSDVHLIDTLNAEGKAKTCEEVVTESLKIWQTCTI